MSLAGIPIEVQERIRQAAEALYEESGRTALPTVGEVRRNARVDMNAASAVMKEWRNQQMAPAIPTVVTVPETLQQTNAAAVASLWTQAQELANESLRAAQTAWEAERVEFDTLRAELAEAYEQQAAEIEQLKADTTAAAQVNQAAAQRAAEELTAARTELSDAHRAAVQDRERAAELSGHLAALRQQNTDLLARLVPAEKTPSPTNKTGRGKASE